MAEKNDSQNKYMQMQMLDQQIKKMQEYLETFDNQIMEISHLIASLEEFSELKKGDKILAPIANGMFIEANLENSENIRINVGNNTVVTKTIPEAIKMLKGQEAEITSYREETLEKMNDVIEQVEMLQNE